MITTCSPGLRVENFVIWQCIIHIAWHPTVIYKNIWHEDSNCKQKTCYAVFGLKHEPCMKWPLKHEFLNSIFISIIKDWLVPMGLWIDSDWVVNGYLVKGTPCKKVTGSNMGCLPHKLKLKIKIKMDSLFNSLHHAVVKSILQKVRSFRCTYPCRY